MVASPRPAIIAGREYMLHPLTDADRGEFAAWVQERILAINARACASLSPEAQVTLTREAMAAYHRVEQTLDCDEAKRITATSDGAARLLWLSMRRTHGSLSVDDVRQMIAADPHGAIAAISVMNRANGFDGEEKKTASTPT